MLPILQTLSIPFRLPLLAAIGLPWDGHLRPGVLLGILTQSVL